MAKLYGRLQGNRGEVTRCGSEVIEAKLETWEGSVRTVLRSDGTFQVFIGDKGFPQTIAVTGNINDRPVSYDTNPHQ